MKLVCDIEANGLYEEADTIHCAVFKDVDTGKVYRLTKKESIIRMLERCTYLIMHNGVGYDIPLIKKVYGYEYKGKILDTVLMSREVYKNKKVPNQMKEDCKTAGKKLSGPHSLAAWGYRLERGKVEHEDWSVFSDEMMHRCVEDVEITHLLYRVLMGLEPKFKTNNKPWNKEEFPSKALWLTHDFMRVISRQEKHGWKLDIERCERSLHQLSKWIRWIDVVLESHLPVLPIIKEDRLDENGDSNGFQNPFTKAGDLNVRLQNWIDKEHIDWNRDTIGGSFCRVTFRKVSLNSDKETKEWLLAMGWQPEEYNYSKKEVDEDGNPKRTSPKLNSDDAFIGVDGKVGRLICKRVQCRHRQSNIQGWLDRVRSDGRLESRISGFADTYRVRHANIANVPNVNSFYGKIMRKCFTCEEGMVLVSADAAACQDRMIISRARDVGIKDPIFEDMILNGDKAKGTDSHSRARDEINILFAKMGLKPINRGSAKNFSYAYKFGGGAKKLGFMAGEKNETKAIKIGKAIKEAFDTVFQAQIELQEHLKKEWKERSSNREVKYKWKGREQEKKEYYNGRIKALDGRDVLIRDEKNILVYTVQSDEALVMQHATVLANQRLDEKYKDGIDFKQVGFFHDEYTFEVRPQIAEDVKVILEESIAIAGKDFNLNLPQIGEGEIGYNWSEIH
jgi:DNA polymerase-1